MIKKLTTWSVYLWEYLKHGDFKSILNAATYMLAGKSNSHDRIITTSVGRFYCRKNTNDFQYANYRYEWGVKKFILSRLGQFNVFIDGGSGVGEYCLLLAQKGVKCIALEPVDQNFQVLRKNLILNDLESKVMAFPYGLGDRTHIAPFRFNTVNTGASHVIRNGLIPDCMAEIRTLDGCFHEFGLHPDDRILIKLDVEHMEPEAIAGSRVFFNSFDNITVVAEYKHSGEEFIRKELSNLATFNFGIVDESNLFADKVRHS